MLDLTVIFNLCYYSFPFFYKNLYSLLFRERFFFTNLVHRDNVGITIVAIILFYLTFKLPNQNSALSSQLFIKNIVLSII